MPVAGLLTTTDEFVAWNGGSGIYRPQAVADALVMAEGTVATWLNTALVPTEFVDEFDWPVDDNRMYLRKLRLISITSIEALYSNGDCTWQTSEECSTILNARMSIIRIRDPWRRWCSGQRCPERMRVTYQAGFTAAQSDDETIDGVNLRAVIFNAALGHLQMGIGLNAMGNMFVPSYQAAGYNESRQLPEMSGAVNMMNQHMLYAEELARQTRLKIKRPIMFRSREGRPC